MNKKNNILNNIKKQNVYLVPNNYFTYLAQQILLKINAKQNIYNIPKNYFDNNISQILAKITTQKNDDLKTELDSIAPVLNTISKQNVYQVPNYYFNNIVYIQNKPLAKVVTLNTKKWYKYAVAAVIILGIGFSFLVNTNKNNNQFSANYNKALKTNVDTEITTITDRDLNNAIDPIKTNFTTEETTQTNIPFTNNIQSEVELLTDEEIEQYINKNNNLVIEITHSNS